MKTVYADIPAYVTRDGSQIRELMHPDRQPVVNQSLAEALVPPGGGTRLHRHLRTEELYHIIAGRGRMQLGEERFEVGPGETVLIPPGTLHRIDCLSEVPLRILCCCAPAYSHADTELL